MPFYLPFLPIISPIGPAVSLSHRPCSTLKTMFIPVDTVSVLGGWAPFGSNSPRTGTQRLITTVSSRSKAKSVLHPPPAAGQSYVYGVRTTVISSLRKKKLPALVRVRVRVRV